jgi:hypothetical protein
MPEETLSEVAFLGWAERATSVHEGENKPCEMECLGPQKYPVDEFFPLLAQRLEFGKTDELLLLQAEHEVYLFQIKTTAANEYRSSLPINKVHQLWHKAINLVVVFWANERTASAVVFPPSLIRMLTSGGFEDPRAPLIMAGNFVSLRFIERGGRYFIRNYDHEITAMLNRFYRIEPIGTDTSMFPNYAYWADPPALVAFDSDERDPVQHPRDSNSQP